ncbi:MAG: type II secretion system protein N [Candidatus Hydrogenedentales bacterium]
MIRSLVIRQIFRMLDMALVVMGLGVGILVAHLFMTPLEAVELLALEDSSGTDEVSLLKTVQDKSVYEGLAKSGLFGSAGQWDADAAPVVEEEEPIDEDITESTLDLKLRGTIALSPKDPFASAFIENLENRDGVRSYPLNKEVVENVFVDTIYPREIILLNKRKEPAQREWLRMEEKDSENKAPAPALPGAPLRPVRSRAEAAPERNQGTVQHTKVDRQEIVSEAIANYSTLATITPRVEKDAQGNVMGLTADGISQHPLAVKLGFQDGDMLQSINNEKIESREQLFEIFQRYQNATSFRVGILRNGQPNILVFDVN